MGWFNDSMTTQQRAAPNAPGLSARLSPPITQLKASCVLTIGFGLMIAFGAHELTDGPLRWFADLLFWPLGDPAILTDEAQLLSAILGGVMTSWAVLIWMLTDALGTEKPELLRRIIFTTMAIWFVIDSAASVASGGWLNVIGNIGFLAMFVIPTSRLR